MIPKALHAIRNRSDNVQEFQWIDRQHQSRENKRGGGAQPPEYLGHIRQDRIHALDSSRLEILADWAVHVPRTSVDWYPRTTFPPSRGCATLTGDFSRNPKNRNTPNSVLRKQAA